jgi:hypothetical protein
MLGPMWAIIKKFVNKVVIVKIENLHFDGQGKKGKTLEFLKFWHLEMGMYDGSVYGGSKV